MYCCHPQEKRCDGGLQKAALMEFSSAQLIFTCVRVWGHWWSTCCATFSFSSIMVVILFVFALVFNFLYYMRIIPQFPSLWICEVMNEQLLWTGLTQTVRISSKLALWNSLISWFGFILTWVRLFTIRTGFLNLLHETALRNESLRIYENVYLVTPWPHIFSLYKWHTKICPLSTKL